MNFIATKWISEYVDPDGGTVSFIANPISFVASNNPVQTSVEFVTIDSEPVKEVISFELEPSETLEPVSEIHMTFPYGDNVSLGEPGSALEFSEIELVKDIREEILEDVLSIYKGFSYRKYESKHPGDPFIRPGSYVTTVDKDGNSHKILVTSRDFVDNGAWRMDVTADIPSQEEVNTNYVGTYEKYTGIVVDKVNQDIEALVENFEQSDKEMVSIKNQVNINTDGITNLSERVTTSESSIKEQSGRLDIAYDKIEANVIETSKVKDRVNNTEKQLNIHEGKISATSREVTALSRTVDSQGNKLANAEIKLDGVAGNVTINANNIKNKIDKGKAAQDINTGTVAINADKIKLEGYTTINGNFAVDWWGNMSAKNATISGSLIAEIGGKKMAELKNSGLTIFNRDGSGRKIGILEAVRDVGTSNSGVSLSHEDGSYLAISYWDSGLKSYIRYMSFDKYNIIQDSKYDNYPIHFGHNTYFGGNIEASRVIARSDFSLDFGSAGRRQPFTKLTNNEVRLNVYEIFPRAGHGGIIGRSSNRYDIIYLKSQPNVSSDLRQKENIRNLPDKLLEMLMDIQPKMYEQDGKIHFGYIAQDIERSLYKYAVSEVGWEHAKEFIKDFAFLHKDESYLSLLYGEIAVLKDAQFRKRINELEYKIEKLEDKINE